MLDKTTNNEKQIEDLSYNSIAMILNSLDAFVYVSDMDTYELLFSNDYGRKIWGDIKGQICWKVLQIGQDGPCTFCTNDRLVDKDGQPTGVYVWEFQNTVDKHWYQCRDQAITWVDGRLVRIEIATDITERKLAEEELRAAKERVEALAYSDELTGLNNRRVFFDQGHHILKQAIRYKHHMSVIMMDIDHFKNINDKYGHSMGDKVLQSIVHLLKNMVREIDIVARMGGEEFAFILPETGPDEATELAERLRAELANRALIDGEEIFQVTASFGVCSYPFEQGTLGTLLSKADEALYVAKKKGRNQVIKC